jgi:periplasmic protein CpxP/Spy
MKRSIKTLLVAATLAGGITAGLAYAMPPGHGEGCAHGRGMSFGRHGVDSEMRIDRMSEALDLTHEQRDKVRAIVDKARPATRQLRDKLADNHHQLRALMQQDNPKDSEVRKLADAQGKLIADMIVQRTKVQSEIRAVLTPEQRERLQQRFGRRGPVSSFGPDSGPASLSDSGTSPDQRAMLKQVAM